MTPDLHERLPSGVDVVIARMDAPEVVIEHRITVGAAHEAEDGRGAAHLVEHLLCPDDFSRRVRTLGGDFNAYTFVDHTSYRTVVPKAALAEVFPLEAKRFLPHALAEADVAREVRVTAEERAWRVEHAVGLDRAVELAGELFPSHPYGRAVAPPIPTILQLDRSDAQAFFDRWYRAERLTLIVAGPVEPKDVYASLAKLYAGMPTGAPSDPFPTLDAWDAPAEVRGEHLPNAVAWRLPPRSHPDAAALRWIAAMSPSLGLAEWEQGGLLYALGAPGELDRLAGAFQDADEEWIDQDALDEAVDEAALGSPPWSPEAWVDAWGVPPAPGIDALRRAWRVWVQGAEPIRLREGP